jgi:hypothetical protein
MKALFQRTMLCLMAGLLLLLPMAAVATEADAKSSQAPQPQATAEPTDSPKPAKGYVLVTTATQSGWLPLPEEGEVSYPLRQLLPNGTEAVNTIHLTPEGVYMEHSTCDGQDCVQQGEVTLDNRDARILGNMIICLPNQVTLQLFTPEELLEMAKGQQ